MAKSTINTKDNIFFVINLVLAVIMMGLIAALTGTLFSEDIYLVAIFLGLTIFSQVLFQVLLFVVKDRKRDRIRVILVGILYVIAMAMAFMGSKNFICIYLANSFVCAAMALNQFLLIEKEETKKGKVTNIILGIFLTFLAIALVLEMTEEDALIISFISVLLFLFVALKKLLFPSLKIEKVKLLVNILVKTHTIDVLICLLSFMIAFSFILPQLEVNITNFWDALWYCFTVITTIGFGDFVAASKIGRILTVILGIYGIVVVAILTSVIVNFYNEVSAKEKARDIIE